MLGLEAVRRRESCDPGGAAGNNDAVKRSPVPLSGFLLPAPADAWKRCQQHSSAILCGMACAAVAGGNTVPLDGFIAFTGSMEVGLHIWETAGHTAPGQPNLEQVIREMGGRKLPHREKRRRPRRSRAGHPAQCVRHFSARNAAPARASSCSKITRTNSSSVSSRRADESPRLLLEVALDGADIPIPMPRSPARQDGVSGVESKQLTMFPDLMAWGSWQDRYGSCFRSRGVRIGGDSCWNSDRDCQLFRLDPIAFTGLRTMLTSPVVATDKADREDLMWLVERTPYWYWPQRNGPHF